MNVDDAEEYTQALGQVVAGGWRQISLGRRLGVPQALGLSVEEWVEKRLGGYVKFSIAERRQAVAELREQGESQRAIAEVLGVDHKTVCNDISAGENSPPTDLTALADRSNSTSDGENSPLDTLTALAADDALIREIQQKDARETKREEVIARLDAVAAAHVEAPTGQYDVIVVDPPWPMTKIDRDVSPNQVAFDYPTMSVEEIEALGIPAATDCHVWLWTTQRFLLDALDVFDAWGVKYVCAFVWHKPGGFQPFGMPQFNCEFALYGRIGTPIFLETKAFPTCFSAARGKHSEKPTAFYDTIRRITGGRRLDMFNRKKIEGFDAWGQEAEAV